MPSVETKSPVRRLAVELLSMAERTGTYIDHALEASLATGRLDGRDRALLIHIVNGVLRHQTFLDMILQNYVTRGFASQPLQLKSLLRTAIYQLRFLDSIPAYAAVSETVQIARELFGQARSKFVNAVLRSYLRQPYSPPEPAAADIEALSTYHSHPVWLARRFAEQYGVDELAAWMQANNRIPTTFVRRLHPAKPQPAASQEHPEIAGYFAVNPQSGVQTLPGWEDGSLLVQDPSAGLAVALAGVQPGDSVIDFCAAPGGKTVALAIEAGPRARVIAVDAAEARLRKLRENLARTQQQQVEVVLADARQISLPPADVVLVDAPCSGSGVLSRRADLRWRRRPGDFANLQELQRAILANAAKHVLPGGRLIYATCSIDIEENEAIVEAFLQQHPSFHLQTAGAFVSSTFVTDKGYVKTLPHRHAIDGSFAARFIYEG